MIMITTSPKKISGRWDGGYALDYHTVSSNLIGHDEFGHPQFDTTRTEMGELLYRLKFGNDQSVIRDIVATAADFVRSKKTWSIDLVIAVPPSSTRNYQPVIVLAEKLAKSLGVEYCKDCVKKIKSTPQLKNVFGAEERKKLLAGVFQADRSRIQGKSILLFDDLFRSGATMNEVASLLKKSGRAKHIYAFALTRTRVHR
jgi:predicted amidophosphoribosyltransferase